jgi:Bacteriophage head to tail connecting protein
MARKPATTTPEDPLQKEANDRVEHAKTNKAAWAQDFMECYFLAAPHRQRQMMSSTAMQSERRRDAAELQTSLTFILVDDFATEILNTYMPEAQNWCERGPGMFVPKAAYDKIAQDVRDQDSQIFEAIKASNLYSELPKSFKPDLAMGTVGLWLHRRRPSLPIEVLAVPIHEMELSLGPDGKIDDRFVVRHTRNCYVRALLPKDAVLDADTAKQIADNPASRTEIRWGFWRLWDRDDDEVWQHVILIKNNRVYDEQLVGEGSCPLVVGRFNPTADWVWGIGPLMQHLPDLRQVDELQGAKIDALDLSLRPPITYPNDSFANVEDGLEPGMAYPIMPGSENAVKKIYEPPPPDVANYATQEMEHQLRKGFYVDYPEQTGDTPPTLGQWLDEMARAQRRIGTPGLPFWREVCMPIFLRFKYLLEKAGAIQPIKVDGKSVSLRPYNPAQRAAEQQEIATATQFAQIMSQMFPEEWKMVVDGRETMAAFMMKMRVSGLIKVRDKNQVDAFVKQLAPLLAGGTAPGATPPPAAGAPGPAPA